MSVTIATSPTQSPTLLQRLFGTEPKTVVKETSVTTIVNDPGTGIDWKTALRNGGIGAAIGGALGGVSLLTKVALPLIGKVGSLAGVARLAGTGGAIGAAIAAVPFLVDVSRRNPTAKAAIIGGSIGAAAGAVLPFLPVWLGAAAGAGIGLVAHKVTSYNQEHPAPLSPYPGYTASPGWSPYGQVPNGMTPVMPYGQGVGYGPGVGFGQGMGYGQGYPVGYGASFGGYPAGYGAQILPQTAMGAPMNGQALTVAQQQALLQQQQMQMLAAQQGLAPGAAAPQVAPGAAAPSVAAPVAAPTAAPVKKVAKFPNAKTWVDKAGNVRQVGTGKVLKAAAGSGAGTSAAVGSVPSSAAPGVVPTAQTTVLPQNAAVAPATTSSLPKLSTAGLAGIDLSSITNPTAPSSIPMR